MNKLIDKLKDPILVLKCQEFFGVERIKNKNNDSMQNKHDGNDKHNSLSPESDFYLNDSFHSNCNGKNHFNENVSYEDDDDNESKNEEHEKYQDDFIIKNKFWYYLFLLGTEFGDEIFYANFVTFWFWNIDTAVGRRVIFVWSIAMYIGQSLKEIFRWPRPGYPVIRLQNKWMIEYGMPSTHAMVAVSIPFSILIFTYQRYQYNIQIGLVAAILWCSIICVSRIYLGMHSVCDVVAGILLTILIMLVLVPLIDFLDIYIVTNIYSPIFILLISITLIAYFPCSDKWTPTRGDTVMIISVCAGLQIGAWINYQLGNIKKSDIEPPYEIIWPTYQMLGLLILRTVLGMCCIVATIVIGKLISYGFLCALLGKNKTELRNSKNSLENKDKIIVELSYKYFTYGLVGLNTHYLLPNVFKLLSIGRPDFYTEL